MSSSSTIPFVGIEKTLLHTQWHGYIEVAASTLVFWNYFLTFEDELELIWRRPKNGVTVVFLVNRYLAMIAQLVTTYAVSLALALRSPIITFLLKTTGKFAIAYWLIGTSILQLVITDGIVWLCVCALYQNSKKVRWPLLGLMAVCVLAGAAVLGAVGSHSKGASELIPGIKRCTVYTQYHNLWLFWIPILVYETTTLILVLQLFIRYLRNRKQWASNLLELLLKDMLLYLVVIFVTFICNAVLFANPDPTLAGILDPPTVVLLSILGNRMLFNLRAENKRSAVGMVYQSGDLERREGGHPHVGAGGETTGIGLESMRFAPVAIPVAEDDPQHS
ncbi:hypothetical protein BT96DRAFT_997349 [Gymnopus androsaceus JB14]|uniref:DUF6533 domain-containing protein n=1 Tax=Gymnopus androsaceus JB14 TaxID=1447944 RepID=A0A6A4HEU5_9AGAR|nr:hypothetical protein BT96DRAFT_997349 [Gymnopus androsaceus JB14]